MMGTERKPKPDGDDEDLGVLEFIYEHKIALLVLLGIGFAVLLVSYWPSTQPAAVNPRENARSEAAASPESAEPVNAFNGGVGKSFGRFLTPRGLAVDNKGHIFVADTENGRVQKFDPTGSFILAFDVHAHGRTGPGQPIGIAVDQSGNIFTTDLGTHTLMKFDSEGKFLAEWRGPDPGFYGPLDIAAGPNGELYIVDSGRLRIVRFDPTLESFTAWGTEGSEPAQFSGATGITVAGEEVFVADTGNERIQVFDLSGEFRREWSVPAWQKYPWHYPDLIVSDPGTIYVTNGWKHEILAYDLKGNPVEGRLPPSSALSLRNPSALTIAQHSGKGRMLVLNTEGAKLTSVDLPALPDEK